MAFTSSYFPTHEVEKEIRDLADFIDAVNLDELDSDFIDVIKKEERFTNIVLALQEKFKVTFSEMGFSEVLNLVTHFELNHNPEYIVQSFSKFAAKIPEFFVGLPRRPAASKFIIQNKYFDKYSC